MIANPILAKNMRFIDGNSAWVENIHRGAFCLIDAGGKITKSAGDIKTPIFPHSAIKSMQAMALFASGAVEKFSLDKKDIALSCASHNGDVIHIEGVQRFLKKIGCSVDDLECGVHVPLGKGARKVFFATGEPLSAIYNACSGKHAGMLAVARALGVATKGYSEPSHEVQQLVQYCIEQVIGQDLKGDRCAVDGCSVPTFAAPLESFALGFARMSSGSGLSVELANAAKQIFSAGAEYPILIRGESYLDSDLIAAFNGRLMIKNGAEGVYCGVLHSNNKEKNIGFALKIDDGNLQVSEVVVANILLNFANANEQEEKILRQYCSKQLKNWRNISVGEIISASDLFS